MRVLREPARSTGAPRRGATVTAGVVFGGIVGGVVLASVGYVGIIAKPGPNLLWGIFFIMGFVGALFGMVAPLAPFFFLGARQETRARRQLFRAAGVLALFVFYPALGLTGKLVIENTTLHVESALTVLVVLDAIGGITVGAILGLVFAERLLARGAATGATST